MQNSLRFSAALFLAIACSIATSWASDLPRFDGVYIETRDGQFIQLQRIEMEERLICAGGGIFGQAIASFNAPRNRNAITGSPAVEFGSIESIFIRSRTERLRIVMDAAEFSSLTSRLPRGNDMRIATPVFQGTSPSCLDGARQSVNWSDTSIVPSECGFWAERFNLLNESPTTWQYFERGGFTFGARTANALGDCGGARHGNIQTRGIFIGTNQGYYYVSFQPQQGGRAQQDRPGPRGVVIGRDRVVCHNPVQNITWEVSGGRCPSGWEVVD